VLVDDTWHDAEIRSWDRDEHGHWSAYVHVVDRPRTGKQLERFPQARVRQTAE